MRTSTSAFAEMLDRSSVRYVRLLPGPIDRIWSYLTESDKRAKWLAAGPMELVPGGAMTFVFRNDDLSVPPEPAPAEVRSPDGPPRLLGLVLRCEPPRLLVLQWGQGPDASEVTFELEPVDDQVRLVLTHRRMQEALRLSFVSGWHVHLDTLAAVSEGTAPAGFWSRWLGLRDHYGPRIGA